MQLTLNYTVRNFVSLTPDRLILPEVIAGEKSISKPVTLKTNMPNVKLVDPKATSDHADVLPVLKKVVKGREYSLTLEMRGAYKTGDRIDGVITIKTGIAAQPEIRLPFLGSVIDRVRAIPAMLSFGTVPHDDLRKNPARYQLSTVIDYPGGAGNALALGAVSSTNPAVVYSGSTALLEGRRFVLRFALDPQTAAGPLSGSVKIATNDAKMKAVELPISGDLQP